MAKIARRIGGSLVHNFRIGYLPSCTVIEVRVCEQLARVHYIKEERPGVVEQ